MAIVLKGTVWDHWLTVMAANPDGRTLDVAKSHRSRSRILILHTVCVAVTPTGRLRPGTQWSTSADQEQGGKPWDG